MILDTALSYQPDEIVWLITWGTLKPSSRLDHPLIAQNPAEFYKLARRFDFLPGNYKSPDWITQLTDRNRTLFRVLRYQLYSLINIATGLDQIPGPKEVLPVRLSGDLTFEGMHPPKLDPGSVSIDQIQDFYQLAHDTPVWLINEPMLVLSGIPNSDVRYNVFYPRWIYDQYRQYVHAAAAQNHWNYLDLWNMFPPGYYTDTPFHLNPDGEAKLAKVIAAALVKGCP
ncbi:MAG TPA: hypothetical protein VLZ89_13785 [Anaerolineales bacterium]|nr:hypothetical protein [Anaerolineales bacterium]